MPELSRNEPLDWLRGLLAASIMVYHLVAWEIVHPDASTLLGRLGVYGVSMFFILSGLSIALVYHRFFVDASTSARFFVRRIFRIWPLLWVAVIVVSGTLMARGEAVSWKLVLANLTTLFGFVKPTAYINAGAWSIGNEMVYYALTPIIVGVYNKSRHWGNLLTCLTIGLGMVFSHLLLDAQVAIADQWQVYVNPFNNLFLYCCGIALYYNAEQIRPSRAVGLAAVVVGLAVFVFHPVDGNQVRIVTGWNRVVFCGASVAIVFGFYKHGIGLGRLLAFPLTHLGLATYGVYLLHPILRDANLALAGLLHVEPTPAAVIGGTIVTTVIVAWLSYHFYEVPLIRWGKKLTSATKRPEADKLGRAPV